MAFSFPTTGLSNGTVYVTPSGVAYTYNSATNSWSPGFNRSQLINQNFSAAQGQTTFTILGGYVPTFLDIWWRGTKLAPSDYTATNGTTVVFNFQCSAGDDVQVRSFSQFSVANSVQRYSASGDTMDNVVIGSSKPAAATITSLNSGPLAGFRNRILNGQFKIDQRNEGANVTNGAGGVFGADRWAINGSSAGLYTAIRTTANLPIGAPTSYLMTSSAATTLAAGTWAAIYTRMEGINMVDFAYGTSFARTTTLSFVAYASIAGTYSVAIQNSAANRSYVATYSIPTANTLTNIAINIPGDTTGTWLVGTGVAGACILFNLGAGSNYQTTANTWSSGNYQATSSTISTISTNGATFQVTNVQWELGSTATPFEQRPYEIELARCQRYFEKSYDEGYTFGSNGPGGIQLNCSSSGAGGLMTTVFYKVVKASIPTVTLTPYSTNSSGNVASSGGTVAGSVQGNSRYGFNGGSAANSTMIWVDFHFFASAEIA